MQRRWQAIRGRTHLREPHASPIEKVLKSQLTFKKQGEDDLFHVYDKKKRKYIVHIDRRHTCTCPSTQRPCDHMVFILLKYYRMQPESHCIHKVGLSHHERNALKKALKTRQTNIPIVEENAECAVCCDVLKEADRCVWCRKCGNALHQHCMQSWAEHQLLQNEASQITCIFCRAPFDLLDVYEDFKLPKIKTPIKQRTPPASPERRVTAVEQGVVRQTHQLNAIQNQIDEASNTTSRLSTMLREQDEQIHHIRHQMRETSNRIDDLVHQQHSWNDLSTHQQSVAQFIHQIRNDMQQRDQSMSRLKHMPILHPNHTCSTCAMSPIRGVLYKCTVCLVELCQDCHTSHPHQQFKCRKHAFANPSLGWVDTTAATLRGTNRLQSLIQQSQQDRESLANRLNHAVHHMNDLQQSIHRPLQDDDTSLESAASTTTIPTIQPAGTTTAPLNQPIHTLASTSRTRTPPRHPTTTRTPLRHPTRTPQQQHNPPQVDSSFLLVDSPSRNHSSVNATLMALQYRDITPDDYGILNELPPVKVQSKNKSLLLGYLSTLATANFKYKEKACPICLDKLKGNVVPLKCSHVYHQSCLTGWIQQEKESCPVCFAPLLQQTKRLKGVKKFKKKKGRMILRPKRNTQRMSISGSRING